MVRNKELHSKELYLLSHGCVLSTFLCPKLLIFHGVSSDLFLWFILPQCFVLALFDATRKGVNCFCGKFLNLIISLRSL